MRRYVTSEEATLKDQLSTTVAELAAARDTNRELNRRNQELESLTADYRWALENCPAPLGYEGIYAVKRPREVIAAMRPVVEAVEAIGPILVLGGKTVCFYCDTELKPGAEHDEDCPWVIAKNLVVKLTTKS